MERARRASVADRRTHRGLRYPERERVHGVAGASARRSATASHGSACAPRACDAAVEARRRGHERAVPLPRHGDRVALPPCTGARPRGGQVTCTVGVERALAGAEAPEARCAATRSRLRPDSPARTRPPESRGRPGSTAHPHCGSPTTRRAPPPRYRAPAPLLCAQVHGLQRLAGRGIRGGDEAPAARRGAAVTRRAARGRRRPGASRVRRHRRIGDGARPLDERVRRASGSRAKLPLGDQRDAPAVAGVWSGAASGHVDVCEPRAAGCSATMSRFAALGGGATRRPGGRRTRGKAGQPGGTRSDPGGDALDARRIDRAGARRVRLDRVARCAVG